MYAMLFTTTMHPEYLYLIQKDIDERDTAKNAMIEAEIERLKVNENMEQEEQDEEQSEKGLKFEPIQEFEREEESDEEASETDNDDSTNWFIGFEQELGINVS